MMKSMFVNTFLIPCGIILLAMYPNATDKTLTTADSGLVSVAISYSPICELDRM